MLDPTPVAGVSVAPDVEPGEPSSVTGPRSHAVVQSALAEHVLAVPGVVRLEPTLSTSGPTLLIRSRATDGIRLLTRAGVAEVVVNIATDASCQARSVTHQVKAVIGQTLTAHGYRAGSVTVSVLAVEVGQSTLR